MADKIFNTRIQLKYDTYANWQSKNPVLKSGEVGICVIPAETGAVTAEPAILMKVGDGAKTWTQLSFVTGLAGDVYSWAKASSKPTYTAQEISGLSDYISGEIQDTNTQYKIEADKDNGRKFYLYSKEKGGNFGTTPVSTIEIPEKVYTLATGTVNGTVKFNETDVAVKGLGSAAYTEASAYDASGAASNVKTTLEAKIGTVTEGKTVVEMISDAQAAATYDDTALAGRVTTVEGKVTTLIGDDASKSARTIASEEVAKIVAGADASYATLKEIADWISRHKTDATAMNSAIVALEAIVDGIGGDGEKATVVEYVTDAITALKIGDYAKAADLTALAGRVTTLEGQAHTHSNKALLDTYTQTEVDLADAVAKKHEHSNKAVLDGITAEKVTAWDKVSEKANDADLATIAKTGNVNDLIQTAGDILVFDCGSSSVNI